MCTLRIGVNICVQIIVWWVGDIDVWLRQCKNEIIKNRTNCHMKTTLENGYNNRELERF